MKKGRYKSDTGTLGTQQHKTTETNTYISKKRMNDPGIPSDDLDI